MTTAGARWTKGWAPTDSWILKGPSPSSSKCDMGPKAMVQSPSMSALPNVFLCQHLLLCGNQAVVCAKLAPDRRKGFTESYTDCTLATIMQDRRTKTESVDGGATHAAKANVSRVDRQVLQRENWRTGKHYIRLR